MHDDIDRKAEKHKMAIYTFWLGMIVWVIGLHYYAVVGILASLTP